MNNHFVLWYLILRLFRDSSDDKFPVASRLDSVHWVHCSLNTTVPKFRVLTIKLYPNEGGNTCHSEVSPDDGNIFQNYNLGFLVIGANRENDWFELYS